jgi:transposase
MHGRVTGGVTRATRRYALVGLDRRTVKPHVQTARPPVYRRLARASKLAACRPLIEPWRLRAPGLRATRIHRDWCPHDGCSGSYPLVQRLVRALRPSRPGEAQVRVETAPGQHAQVDWRDEEVSFGQHPGPV